MMESRVHKFFVTRVLIVECKKVRLCHTASVRSVACGWFAEAILSDDNKAINMSTIDVLYLITALNTSEDCSQEDPLKGRLDAK